MDLLIFLIIAIIIIFIIFKIIEIGMYRPFMQGLYETHKRRLELHREIMKSYEEQEKYYNRSKTSPNK